MSDAARVRNVEVVDELRLALQMFADQAGIALETVAAEIRRTAQWLERQQNYWQGEMRRAEDAMFIAKQEMAHKKMMQIGDRPVDTWEEEQALRRAKARLETAQDKQERVRNWLRQWTCEMLDYEGPARSLKSFVEIDLARTCALLQDKAATLEQYLALDQGNASARPSVAQPRPESVPAKENRA